MVEELSGQVRSGDRQARLGRAGRAAAGAVVVLALLLIANRDGADSWTQAWSRMLGWPYSWLALLGYAFQFLSMYDEAMPSWGLRRVGAVLYRLVAGGMMLYTTRAIDLLPWRWAEIAVDGFMVLPTAAVLARGLRQLLVPASATPSEAGGSGQAE